MGIITTTVEDWKEISWCQKIVMYFILLEASGIQACPSQQKYSYKTQSHTVI